MGRLRSGLVRVGITLIVVSAIWLVAGLTGLLPMHAVTVAGHTGLRLIGSISVAGCLLAAIGSMDR
jgi:hypothetical protein